jgi:hypothetical protein
MPRIALWQPLLAPIQTGNPENPMRAETYNLVEDIRQSVGLLRRAL